MLGRSGWQLVSAEPHWHWEQIQAGKSIVTSGMNMVRPLAVLAWYCTFKRQTTDPVTGQSIPASEDEGASRQTSSRTESASAPYVGDDRGW